jgi:hypothetical protein
MLGALGMLVTEEPIEYHPLFEAYNKDIGPAIRHLDEVRAVSPYFFELLAIVIGGIEFNRAINGWNAPTAETIAGQKTLRDEYFPGGKLQLRADFSFTLLSLFVSYTCTLHIYVSDVGFDPLGLKPSDAEGFATMSTKELQNGRLAMLGFAGMVAQELVNGKEIFVNAGLATDRFDPSTLPIQF